MYQPHSSVTVPEPTRLAQRGHDLDAEQRADTNLILHVTVYAQDYEKALEVVPSSVLALYRKAQVLRALHKV
jgi:hypothetical protein